MSHRKPAASAAHSPVPEISAVERLIAEAGAVHAHLSPKEIDRMACRLDLPAFALAAWLQTFHIEGAPVSNAAIAARALASWLWAARQFFQGDHT
jgi:hypothetical protein